METVEGAPDVEYVIHHVDPHAGGYTTCRQWIPELNDGERYWVPPDDFDAKRPLPVTCGRCLIVLRSQAEGDPLVSIDAFTAVHGHLLRLFVRATAAHDDAMRWYFWRLQHHRSATYDTNEALFAASQRIMAAGQRAFLSGHRVNVLRRKVQRAERAWLAARQRS